MKFTSKILMLVSLLWLSAITVQAAESVPVKSGRITAQLVTSHDSVMPGDDIHIALSLRMEPHWHTYWRNAGGPGYPAEIKWDMPDSLSVGEMVWSLPQIILTGQDVQRTDVNKDILPSVSYAFENHLVIPMPLHISDTAKIGEVLTIRAEASYLVCYKLCLPEDATFTLPLVVGEPIEDNRWSSNIRRTLKKAPKAEAGFGAGARLEDGKFLVDIKSDVLKAGTYRDAYFFPYIQDQIDVDQPQVLTQGTDGIRLSMVPSWNLEDGINSPVQGVIAYDTKVDGEWTRRGVIVTAAPNTAVAIGAITTAPPPVSRTSNMGLGFAIFSAFLGGMILNLMPCVFPILSLKALGFAKTAHENAGQVRKHGLAYTFGVLLSFMALAVTLLALKASGAAIGWGFQLQNPIMVAGLALLFMVIALNLFGFFEIGGKWQNTGSTLAKTGGTKGAFFTGILAVIVATPCTAPFMAGALGYALAQPAFSALLVFFALGLGFALPFLALSFAPKLLKLMPKPGPWMDTFKQLLAFPMLAAAIWLLWVLAAVGGENAIITTLFAGLALALGLWAFNGRSFVTLLLLVASVFLSAFLLFSLKPAAASPQTETEQAWSVERVAELRADGHSVFVDFTARWCVTCKVNERLVLHTEKGRALFANTNTKVLVADWTRQDERIAKELAKHGRSGVPLYLLYPAGTDSVSPQILPQNLTVKSLEKALKTAQDKN